MDFFFACPIGPPPFGNLLSMKLQRQISTNTCISDVPRLIGTTIPRLRNVARGVVDFPLSKHKELHVPLFHLLNFPPSFPVFPKIYRVGIFSLVD